jgi:pilus assembly protein Flp/PilA
MTVIWSGHTVLIYMKVLQVCKKGQGLAEYALILSLVAIVVIIILGLLGERVNSIFSEIVVGLQNDPDTPEPAEPPPECYSSLLLPIMVGAAGLGAGIPKLFPQKPVENPVT